MAAMGEDIRERTDALDAAGNTTAAIGKGFAIGSAALVSLALFGAYIVQADIRVSDSSILDPEVGLCCTPLSMLSGFCHTDLSMNAAVDLHVGVCTELCHCLSCAPTLQAAVLALHKLTTFIWFIHPLSKQRQLLLVAVLQHALVCDIAHQFAPVLQPVRSLL